MKDINPTLCIIAHLNLNRVGGIVKGEGYKGYNKVPCRGGGEVVN